MYELGQGVDKNLNEASRLYQRAGAFGTDHEVALARDHPDAVWREEQTVAAEVLSAGFVSYFLTDTAGNKVPTTSLPLAAGYYPERAQENELQDVVAMDCLIGKDGWLENCVVSNTQQPWGYGFAAATLRLWSQLNVRVAPLDPNGQVTKGRTFRYHFAWKLV